MTNATVSMDRMVATQCMLYSLAFFNTFIYYAIAGVTSARGRYDITAKLFPVFVLAQIFMPMQGFIIFIRPRYLRAREVDPDRGRLGAFRMVMTNEELDRPRRSGKRGASDSRGQSSWKQQSLDRQQQQQQQQQPHVGMGTVGASSNQNTVSKEDDVQGTHDNTETQSDGK